MASPMPIVPSYYIPVAASLAAPPTTPTAISPFARKNTKDEDTDIACTNVEIEALRKAFEAEFDKIEKKLGGWPRWIISFGVGMIGLNNFGKQDAEPKKQDTTQEAPKNTSAREDVFVSLRLYLSFFSSLEYSEIRNSSSVATAEMLSTGQVTARAR
ncbi:hypothetical protein B9Z19DRAFT_1135803 [Tuber borchii]|uniref:Uncharacterized protein n=1 Tax=Tuber borchii TaxID=42251 RepID=A0A2T6ZCG5_TUBBO|nr:hypothetical protein B9Z19DRAFT_1135803 [Tuber borchii]